MANIYIFWYDYTAGDTLKQAFTKLYNLVPNGKLFCCYLNRGSHSCVYGFRSSNQYGAALEFDYYSSTAIKLFLVNNTTIYEKNIKVTD